MKQLLIHTVITFVGAFLAMSFFENTFEIGNWREASRALVVVVTFCVFVASALLTYLDPPKNNP